MFPVGQKSRFRNERILLSFPKKGPPKPQKAEGQGDNWNSGRASKRFRLRLGPELSTYITGTSLQNGGLLVIAYNRKRAILYCPFFK